MAFWIVTGVLCVIVAGAALVVLLRRGSAARATAEFDLRVYRDQLKEVDRDVARRVIPEADADRIRTEIKRRILDADRAARTGAAGDGAGAPRTLTLAAAGLSFLVIAGGTFATYTRIGAPGYPDLPMAERIERAEEARAARPSQAVAEEQLPAGAIPLTAPEPEPEYAALVQRLRDTVAGRPDDLRGHELLFQHEANLGNFTAAYAAQRRVLELKGPAATAADWANYGDMMVLAAGGYVSPEAESAFARALEADPQNGVARYYTGLALLQTGRPDLTFRVWSRLLSESTPDAPWQIPIRRQIEEVSFRAGVNDYSPPPLTDAPALPGPSAEQMDAAGAMSPGERMEMIEGMVSGLAERLATDGGPPEEWARLIRAYGVLGRTDAAAAIWAEAQQVFPDDITRVPILQAARDAGVAQ